MIEDYTAYWQQLSCIDQCQESRSRVGILLPGKLKCNFRLLAITLVPAWFAFSVMTVSVGRLVYWWGGQAGGGANNHNKSRFDCRH